MTSVNVARNSVWFIDMDGTIAEWRTGCESQLEMPSYFRNLRPTNFLSPLKEFASKHRQAYILIHFLTGCQALLDKHEWMDEYYPEIERERRLFMPCGTRKVDFVKERFGLDSLTEQMILFDNLSKNLHEWKALAGKMSNATTGLTVPMGRG